MLHEFQNVLVCVLIIYRTISMYLENVIKLIIFCNCLCNNFFFVFQISPTKQLTVNTSNISQERVIVMVFHPQMLSYVSILQCPSLHNRSVSFSCSKLTFIISKKAIAQTIRFLASLPHKNIFFQTHSRIYSVTPIVLTPSVLFQQYRR